MEIFNLKKQSGSLESCIGQKLISKNHHNEVVILEFEDTFCVLEGSHPCYYDDSPPCAIVEEEILKTDMDVMKHYFVLEEMGFITQEEIDLYEKKEEEKYIELRRERDLAELERIKERLGIK